MSSQPPPRLILSPAEISRGLAEVTRRSGPFTGHNYRLGEKLYTIENKVVGLGLKARRFLQIAEDVLRRPLTGMRVLDLACCEGYYSVEFALRGAEVLGIEARQEHLDRARFVQQCYGLDTIEYLQGDVRSLNHETHGEFDVVLCLGILYHLDVPDVFRFLDAIASVCRGVAIFDTHIALAPEVQRRDPLRQRDYWGTVFREHAPTTSLLDRLRNAWASVDNTESFWPTRRSLVTMLQESGFTTVMECHAPATFEGDDRVTMVAIKGTPTSVQATHPGFNEVPTTWPDPK
jgi:ubiquinone/menaquinone biosynthesis C-methylase UbiE